jgi:hypothetical protein
MASWQEVSLSEEVVDTVDITHEEVQMTTQTGEPTSAPAPPEGGYPPPNTVPGAPNLEDLEADALEDEELENADLSGSTGQVTLDLANTRRIEELELELSRQKFTNEARLWIDKGVPPHIVTLAKPILELPQAPVIDLSNHGGEKIDVAKVVRDILHETEGFIHLAQERGSGAGFDNPESEADALLESWRNQ